MLQEIRRNRISRERLWCQRRCGKIYLQGSAENRVAEREVWSAMRGYRPLFQLDGGAARLRTALFPGVLDVDDGGETPVLARGLGLPPYALAALLGPPFPTPLK